MRARSYSLGIFDILFTGCGNKQLTRYTDPMLAQCWVRIATLNQHWVSLLYLVIFFQTTSSSFLVILVHEVL